MSTTFDFEPLQVASGGEVVRTSKLNCVGFWQVTEKNQNHQNPAGSVSKTVHFGFQTWLGSLLSGSPEWRTGGRALAKAAFVLDLTYTSIRRSWINCLWVHTSRDYCNSVVQIEIKSQSCRRCLCLQCLWTLDIQHLLSVQTWHFLALRCAQRKNLFLTGSANSVLVFCLTSFLEQDSRNVRNHHKAESYERLLRSGSSSQEESLTKCSNHWVEKEWTLFKGAECKSLPQDLWRSEPVRDDEFTVPSNPTQAHWMLRQQLWAETSWQYLQKRCGAIDHHTSAISWQGDIRRWYRVLQKKQPSNIICRTVINPPPAPLSQCCLRVARGWNTNGCFFWSLACTNPQYNFEVGARGFLKCWRVANMRWLFFLKNPVAFSVLFFSPSSAQSAALQLCSHEMIWSSRQKPGLFSCRGYRTWTYYTSKHLGGISWLFHSREVKGKEKALFKKRDPLCKIGGQEKKLGLIHVGKLRLLCKQSKKACSSFS